MRFLSFGLGISEWIPLGVYLGSIAILVITIFKRSDWGLYYLTALIPLTTLLEKIRDYPMGKDLVDLLVIAIFIGNLMRADENPDKDGALSSSVLTFLFYTYFGLWVGTVMVGLPLPLSFVDERFVQWKNFAILPLLYFLAMNTLKSKKQALILLGVMGVIMLLMSRNFYNTYRFVRGSRYSHDQRLSGTFSYLGPNEIAAFFVNYTMLLVGQVLCQRKWLIRGAAVVVAAVSTYCVLYLFSRGAYLSIITTTLFYGVLVDRRILIVIIVLVIGWQAFLPVSVIDRVQMSQDDEGTVDSSLLGRLEMWKLAGSYIAGSPIVGMGYGTTPYLGFVSYSGTKERHDVHNGYVETVLEMGFVGLFLMLFIFYKGIRKGWALYKSSSDPFLKGLGVGFVAMIISSMTNNLGGDRWFYLQVMGWFWILLGLISRYPTLLAEEQAAKEAAASEEEEAASASEEAVAHG